METQSLRIQLRGETMVVETEKLPEPARLDQALPALKIVDDRAIEMAIRISPKPVTCAKGCSMCCRIQLVPVSPIEAYALWLLVDGLPEPRRSEILARFSDRAARLDEAGLTRVFLNGDLALDSEAARVPVTEYLGLGLICPFLRRMPAVFINSGLFPVVNFWLRHLRKCAPILCLSQSSVYRWFCFQAKRRPIRRRVSADAGKA